MISTVAEKLRFTWQASKRVKAEHGVGQTRQFANLLLLLVCGQLGPKLYYENCFWEKQWPISRQLDFMTQKAYTERVSSMNPKPYQKFSQHKLAEKALLQLLAIPTPRFLGFYHTTKGSTARGLQLGTPAELVQLLKENNGCPLCFKPTEGCGGKGFIVVQGINEDGKIVIRNPDLDEPNVLSIESFTSTYLTHPEGFVIEEYMQQHPELKAFNPSSVNTLRIWVRQQEESINILGALLRIGRAGSLVDNSAQGGIVALLDQDTGKIITVRSTATFPVFYDRHPDSGALLKGQQIPFWQDSLELAKRAIRNFPMATFAGLDIAIGIDGPKIIELNLEPDKISARAFKKSHKELLGHTV